MGGGDETKKIILASCYLLLIATPCWADEVPSQRGILHPDVEQLMNDPEILRLVTRIFSNLPLKKESQTQKVLRVLLQ